MRYVSQCTEGDCGTATAAMVAARSYASACLLLGRMGVTPSQMAWALWRLTGDDAWTTMVGTGETLAHVVEAAPQSAWLIQPVDGFCHWVALPGDGRVLDPEPWDKAAKGKMGWRTVAAVLRW